jgi:acyl carrier protein
VPRSSRADTSPTPGVDRQLEDAFVDALLGWARGLEARRPGAARDASTRAFVEATTVYALRFQRFTAEVIGLERGIVAGMPVAEVFEELVAHKRGASAAPRSRVEMRPTAPNRPPRGRRSAASLERRLATVLCDNLGCDQDDVTPQATLRSLGARQKIDLFQVAVAIETELGVAIPDADVVTLKTVRDVLDHLRGASPPRRSKPDA